MRGHKYWLMVLQDVILCPLESVAVIKIVTNIIDENRTLINIWFKKFRQIIDRNKQWNC